MSEKYYTSRNKKVTLKPIDDVVVVKYKKSVDNKRASDIIMSKESTGSSNVNIKTYPSQKISLVTRPLGESVSATKNFSDTIVEDDEVDFVSSAYKNSESGSLVIITDQINVGFKKEVDKQTIDNILNEYDLSIIKQSKFAPEVFTLKVNNANNSDKTLEVANKLVNKTEVEYTDPVAMTEFQKNSVQIPVGKYFVEQWHLHNTGQAEGVTQEDVKALDAWNITKGSTDITTAVIDDGLSFNHVDLKDNIWTNPDSSAPDKHGYNYFDNLPNPEPIYFRPPFDDLSGNDIHGTPCAGVIGGVGLAESGVYGIAPKCKLLGLKIFGGDPMAPPEAVAEAIRYAGKYADIISCSWGMESSNDSIEYAINDVVQSGRDGKGCPTFVATGNDSTFGQKPIRFPANIPETIAVGASTNQERRAQYSNYGPEIDFVAPSSGGTKDIFTTDVPNENRGFNIGKLEQGDPDGLYTNSFGGTSSATPLAAGIGALILSVNSNLTAEEVRQILRNSCDKIDTNNANYDGNGFSLIYGYGRVNAKRALELAEEST